MAGLNCQEKSDVLKLGQEMQDLAKLLISKQSLLVFGRGYKYATAGSLVLVDEAVCSVGDAALVTVGGSCCLKLNVVLAV